MSAEEGAAGVNVASMTGFARADSEGLGIAWVWEEVAARCCVVFAPKPSGGATARA